MQRAVSQYSHNIHLTVTITNMFSTEVEILWKSSVQTKKNMQ